MEAPVEPAALVLSISLQEGFDGDQVVVHIDDEEVLRQSDVTTDVRIGRALSIDVDMTRLPAVVSVEVPTQNVSGQTTLDAREGTHLGVSVAEGTVRFRVSEQPFGYV